MKRLVCLKCGSPEIRRSKRHGALEWILKRFFIGTTVLTPFLSGSIRDINTLGWILWEEAQVGATTSQTGRQKN